MWIDSRAEFADGTSVGTPNNTTVNVGDYYDTGGNADFGLGGRPLFLVVQVDTAITSGGAATVRFKLSSDSVTSIAVDGTQTEHITSDTFALATLVAGFQVVLPLPMGTGAEYERYLGFQVQETAAQALTGGTVSAFITQDPPRIKSYPDAVN